jgi:hypothetical protein
MYYSDDDNDDGRSAAFESTYHLPTTQDDPHYAPLPTDPVIIKAQELSGFRCAVGLEEGIQCVWDYFL